MATCDQGREGEWEKGTEGRKGEEGHYIELKVY
jgi:hypothetical protein